MFCIICEASSRVGVSMSERVLLGLISTLFRPKLLIIGNEKAAVFPVPVCAIPSKSFPLIRTGIHSLWIGVGCV